MSYFHSIPVMNTIVSIVILLVFVLPGLSCGQAVKLQSFDALFEPSAVVWLPDGYVLIAEDEGVQPLSLFLLQDKADQAQLIRQKLKVEWDLSIDDLEGSARGKNGDIFLITSHSTNKKGKNLKTRELVIRLSLKGNKVQRVQSYGSLRTDIENFLERSFPEILKNHPDINIEGILFEEDLNQLYIGLRTPLHKGRTSILILDNPYAIFHPKGVSASFTRLISLDLGGGGIRAMTFDKVGERYLFANEISNKKEKLKVAVWSWSGREKDAPVRLNLPKIKGIKNVEGMTFVTLNNTRFLLMVCDDGNRKKKKTAHYVHLKSSMLSK